MEYQNVFTYGTLLRGEPNHRLLESSPFVGEAHVWDEGFDMRDLGPYPAVTEGGDGPSAIQGELYEVSAQTMQALDRLEGVNPKNPESPKRCLYYRKRVNIKQKQGGIVLAWIYLMTQDKAGSRPIIEDGDWRSHAASFERAWA